MENIQNHVFTGRSSDYVLVREDERILNNTGSTFVSPGGCCFLSHTQYDDSHVYHCSRCGYTISGSMITRKTTWHKEGLISCPSCGRLLAVVYSEHEAVSKEEFLRRGLIIEDVPVYAPNILKPDISKSPVNCAAGVLQRRVEDIVRRFLRSLKLSCKQVNQEIPGSAGELGQVRKIIEDVKHRLRTDVDHRIDSCVHLLYQLQEKELSVMTTVFKFSRLRGTLTDLWTSYCEDCADMQSIAASPDTAYFLSRLSIDISMYIRELRAGCRMIEDVLLPPEMACGMEDDNTGLAERIMTMAYLAD